jgi:hypothetical protein
MSGERRLERETGIEPATNSLEGCDSTTELLPPSRSRAFGSRGGGQARIERVTARPAPLFEHPRVSLPFSPRPRSEHPWLANRSSHPCALRAKVGGEGRIRTFEAARATDLQSAAFDRFATSPGYLYLECAASDNPEDWECPQPDGAGGGI